MPPQLPERVQTWMLRCCPLDPARPLVVGISGGPDSVTLVHVLKTLGYTLHLAHLDHGLRLDSHEDVALVRRLAREWGLPFTVEQADVRGYADEQGLSLEHAAREVRYRFLFRVAREVQAQAVAVAHTLDDQAETVLLHLIRGSGLTGLQGMKPQTRIWDAHIPLVRPLLGVTREQVLAYCRFHRLAFRIDPSNMDLRFTRNRIRHTLLPLLEQEFNPRIKEALARLARVVQMDMDVLTALEEETWLQVVLEADETFVFWNLEAFRNLRPGLRFALWRRVARHLRPGVEVALEDVERADAWLENPRPGPVDWFAGLYLAWEPPQRLVVARWEADLPTSLWPQVPFQDRVYPLPLGGQVYLEHGWRLDASMPLPASILLETDLRRTPPYEAWLDADTIPQGLAVRARRPGDRFRPLGMGGHSMKVSDFMINVKLPRRARARWPLVVHAEDVVWVAGYRLAHPYRVRPTTHQVVRLRLVPPKQEEAKEVG